MARSFYAILLIITGLLSSCSKGSEPMPAPVYLLDQQWVLTEMDGQAASITAGSASTYLSLSSVANTSTGQTSCNQYEGGFSLDNGSNQLTFSVQASTRASCAGQVQDSRYLALLPQIRRYAISNHQLRLYDATHAQPRLVFEVTK